MEKCLDRSDDMLIIRGVNLFPSQVETVLLQMGETKPHYQLIVDRVNNLDTLELKVEVDEAFFLDKVSQLESLQKKIRNTLEDAIGLGIKVTLVEPKAITRSEGKANRVIDRRKF
jgi:phenylacetate-CoA ligase